MLLLVGTAHLLVGCSADDEIDRGRSPQELAAEYLRAPVLRLVEEVRYCSAEQSAGCQLDGQTFVNVGYDGGVVIGAPTGPVTAFDASGTRLVEYGRSGSGPGEYQFVFGAHVESDGRVVLHDIRQARRVVFAADGSPLASHTDAPDMGMRDFVLDERGFAILSDPPANPGDSVRSEVKLFRDTLPPVVVGYLELVRVMDAEGRAQMSGFFDARPRWDVETDTSALVATGPSLRVTRHFRDGRIVEVVNAPDVGRRAVTSSEIEDERQRRLARPSPNADARAALERAVATAAENAAELHPFASGIRALRDGSFLVAEADVQSDSARWTLFDAVGGVLGQLRLPRGTKVIGGNSKRMLLMMPDERDVPVVAWYRVGQSGS